MHERSLGLAHEVRHFGTVRQAGQRRRLGIAAADRRHRHAAGRVDLEGVRVQRRAGIRRHHAGRSRQRRLLLLAAADEAEQQEATEGQQQQGADAHAAGAALGRRLVAGSLFFGRTVGAGGLVVAHGVAQHVAGCRTRRTGGDGGADTRTAALRCRCRLCRHRRSGRRSLLIGRCRLHAALHAGRFALADAGGVRKWRCQQAGEGERQGKVASGSLHDDGGS